VSHSDQADAGESAAQDQDGEQDGARASWPTAADAQAHGWGRVETEDNGPEYWKNTSTHVLGGATRLSIFSTSDGYTVTVTSHDEYGTLLSSKELTGRPGDAVDANRIASDYLSDYPGEDGDVTIPELSTTFDGWVLTRDTHDKTIWVSTNGDAKVSVVTAGFQSCYCSAKRLFSVVYTEGGEENTLVEEACETHALDVATHILDALPKPVGEIDHTRDALQRVKGIGPAKAHSLVQLGVTSVRDLAHHVRPDRDLVVRQPVQTAPGRRRVPR